MDRMQQLAHTALITWILSSIRCTPTRAVYHSVGSAWSIVPTRCGLLASGPWMYLTTAQATLVGTQWRSRRAAGVNSIR